MSEAMQTDEGEIDGDEVDPTADVLGGSAPLEPMQAARGRAVDRGSRVQWDMRRETKLHQLMPYTLALSVKDDLDQCKIVENAAFPPHERASHEKVRASRSARYVGCSGHDGLSIHLLPFNKH